MTFWQKKQTYKQFLLYIFTGFFLVYIGYVIGVQIHTNSDSIPTDENVNTVNFSLLTSKKSKEVYSLMKRNYFWFDQKTQTELEDAFLKALVDSLGDKHSVYMNASDAKQFHESLAGDFEGIGAVVESVVRGIKIAKVLEKSPAEQAWLLDGDIIVSVDGTNIVGWTTDEAVKIIRGPKGSTVTLGYIRWLQDQSVQFITVIRNVVNVPSVSFEMKEDGIGYIEIATFGEQTVQEFQRAMNSLVGSGATGIILDYRNNGGGYLSTAINMLSLFLPEHTAVVKMRENDSRKNETSYTRAYDTVYTDIPIVVLVNGLSASASEIVAGALQDYERAVIVGERTYGKGSVQDPFALYDGSMVKLTVAKWYTPKDREIDIKGIDPDISVILLDEDYQNKNDRQLQAATTILQSLRAENATVADTIAQFKEQEF